MPSYVFRTQAYQAAVSAGYAAFRTKLDTVNRVWKVYYETGEDTAAEWAKGEGREWIHHTEVEYVDRNTDKPRRVGVLVVNITREELAEEGTITEDADGVWIDGHFLVEPLVSELWEPEKPAAFTGARTPRKAKDPAAPKEASAPRERSAIESPVKAVWRIANEMKGASRSEVVAACIAAGINKSTAGTQYYHWKNAQR